MIWGEKKNYFELAGGSLTEGSSYPESPVYVKKKS